MDDRDRARLADILEHGEALVGILDGVDRVGFKSDRRLQWTVERLLEIIAEAGAGLSNDARQSIDHDWGGLRGMRNVIAHQYGHVDRDLVYTAATKRIPGLLDAIRHHLV